MGPVTRSRRGGPRSSSTGWSWDRLILELAKRHGLRLASVSIHDREEHRTAVVRLLGTAPSTLVDDLWKTGHRGLSVLRMT